MVQDGVAFLSLQNKVSWTGKIKKCWTSRHSLVTIWGFTGAGGGRRRFLFPLLLLLFVMLPVLPFVLLAFLLVAFQFLFLRPHLFIRWGRGPAVLLFLLWRPPITWRRSISLSWLSFSALLQFVSLFSFTIIITWTSTMLSTSPQLLIALRCRHIVFTLLSAGAAYIQNNVFLGVNSDKVSALKGQVARISTFLAPSSNVVLIRTCEIMTFLVFVVFVYMNSWMSKNKKMYWNVKYNCIQSDMLYDVRLFFNSYLRAYSIYLYVLL